MENVGETLRHTLNSLAGGVPTWLRSVPAVEVLRQVWQQQFIQVEGQVRQRPVKEMPPESTWLRSPYQDFRLFGSRAFTAAQKLQHCNRREPS